jgi:hypothetical protein
LLVFLFVFLVVVILVVVLVVVLVVILVILVVIVVLFLVFLVKGFTAMTFPGSVHKMGVKRLAPKNNILATHGASHLLFFQITLAKPSLDTRLMKEMPASQATIA